MIPQFLRGVRIALVFTSQVLAGFAIVVAALAIYGAWKGYSVHARVGPWNVIAEPRR